ncbi:Uncharacterised protein [Raoultella planticola]|uniref:Uncharacterized protein n=1 Tax=Raoultella planticola TaxID=575 RepID=A0A485A9F6_RAOPL|nr:Uncharacterised protein [Raoultella planticola]
MTPEEKENALRAQARRCAEELTKAMSVKPKPKWNAVCPPHPSQALREGPADGCQPGEICQCYWPHEWAVWSGIMKVEKIDVLGFTIFDVERLDPVRVMIENYEPGRAASPSHASERRGPVPGLLWAETPFRNLLSVSAMTI